MAWRLVEHQLGAVSTYNVLPLALERDPAGWSNSIEDEVGGLIQMGVLDQGPGGHGYTKAELLVEGIDLDRRKAVYVGLYHTHKFDRMVISIDLKLDVLYKVTQGT